MNFTLFAITLTCCFSFAVGIFHPEVMTPLGPIRGIQKWFRGKAINTFLGVPYAQPPIGDLRFRKAQPINKYIDTVNATIMPSACQQTRHSNTPFPWDDTKPGHSEDCLYLNIWTPATISPCSDNKKKAVMYWIHGGGFISGSIRDPNYNALAFAAIGNVVVVVVAYRLSGLGFMYSGTEDAPGNVGLHDTLQGLRWVKQNIEAFGGDKNLVTIFGESAGAIACGALAISPIAQGFFNRVILQSESPTSPRLHDDSIARNISQTIAEQLHCASGTHTLFDHPKEVIECLRGIDAEKLQYTAVHPPSLGSKAFYPQIGDEILPKSPEHVIRDLDFHATDLLACVVRDEGSVGFTLYFEKLFGGRGEKIAFITKSQATEILKSVLSFVPNFDTVIDHYLGRLEENDFEGIRKQTFTAMGDALIVCPTLFFAEKFALKNNSYFAVFEHRSSTSPWAKWMGVAHYTEVDFVFGQPLLHLKLYKKGELRLSWAMVKMWTNFAKTGRPARRWPKFSKKHPYYRHLKLTGGPIYGKYPDHHNCDLFRPYGF